MAATKKQTGKKSGATRLVESIEDVEQSSLESVRRFLDTVDGALPSRSDDGPRRKVIDSAFKMVEQLVGASNHFTRNVVKVTEDVLGERSGARPASKKAPAKKAAAKKAPARKAPAKKAAASKRTASR